MSISIEQSLTKERIVNKIRLESCLPKNVFFIVEGIFDSKFFSIFIDNEHCQIVVAGSKSNAIDAIKILSKEGFTCVIAVVDSDFDRLEDSLKTIDTLFYTDTHDLETMILNSPVIAKLLKVYDLDEKHTNMINIKDTLIKAGLPIGYFRWISYKKWGTIDEDSHLSFKKLSVAEFINNETFVTDVEKMIEVVHRNSNKTVTNINEIKGQIDTLNKDKHDIWQVCCGHDLVKILYFILKSIKIIKNSSRDDFEKLLILTYESSYFKSTYLHKSLKQWEENNNSYKIFKPAMMDNNV